MSVNPACIAFGLEKPTPADDLVVEVGPNRWV
jgi:hypothetical protein